MKCAMTTPIFFSYLDSPLGPLCACGDGHSLTGLYLPQHQGWAGPAADWQLADDRFSLVRAQLAEYFAGGRQQFTLPLRLQGTPFQQRVWQELSMIPYGTTITYAQLAQRVGRATASRAVGAANGRNPISIIVPCHRVVGRSGKLTGYAGGLERKRWLQEWELSQMKRLQPICGTLR
jgi:methylated-DNA-[protein]-cysteine S-methyltransferase